MSWEERIIGKLDVAEDGALPHAAWRDVIDIHEGERYQARRVREAVLRLYQTGKIASVEVQVTEQNDHTLAVTFLLEERNRVVAMNVSGNRRFTEKEIHDALGFTPEQPFDRSEWETRQEGLLKRYQQEGYFDVFLESRFKRIPSDRLAMAVSLHVQEGERVRIRRLTFSGEPLFSDRELQGVIGLRPSAYFIQKQLDGGIERLRAFYKNKGYRMARVGPPQITGAVEITLPIVASTRIDLFFHGFGSRRPLFSPDPLEAFIAINEERQDAPEVLEESARALELYYRDQGYPFATVSVEVQSFPEKNLQEVHFTLTHNTRAKIQKIQFQGNAAFPQKRLKSLLQLQEEALFTKTLFTDMQLQKDADQLALFYQRNGFQEVTVHPDIRFDENKEWILVTFRIKEGAQTTIGAVLLDGVFPMSSSALLNQIGLHAGDPFHKGVVREGAAQILTALARLGYIDAKVEPKVTIASGVAAVRYHIDAGKQVFLGSLSLVGNEKTRNVTLLREMRIKPGEPYDYEKILKSQERLNQTGLFSGIRFDPVRNVDDPTLQDIRLTVIERPRFVIEWGPGYGESEGLRGFVDVGHRNLWGSGRQISARASGSHREYRYSLNYKEPRVLPYDVDTTLSGVSYSIPRASFNEKTRAGTLGFERQFSPAWRGVLLYQYEDKAISHLAPGVQLTDQDVGRIIIGSLNPSLTLDTRDDPLQPRKGLLLGITLRDAAHVLGSHVQMVKVIQQGSFFFSLTPRVTLALSERLGVAKRFGETPLIPLSERFFLGGQSTVRGYRYQTLGEAGETVVNGQPTGGNVMVLLNEELRFSLSRSWGLVLFFDHGNVGREGSDFPRLKSTTGIGFRYNTPVGPLRLDGGYKLDRAGGEPPTEYHFTLGHAF